MSCAVTSLKPFGGTVEVAVKATGACDGFRVSEAAALELAPQPAGAVELTGVELKRADGQAPDGEPTLRKLPSGAWFADNLAFTTPGTWTVSLLLRKGAAEERASFDLPVRLTAAQEAETTANAAAVPAFALTDAYGRKITDRTLAGKVWVAGYFFATCPDVCPLLNQKLAALQREIKGADFRTVSVTTDPARDTPEVLAGVAKRHHADRDRWLFLTGDKRVITALSTEGLKLGVAADSASHSTRLAVVGRDGKVKGTYDSAKPEELEQLKITVRELLARK